MASWTFAVGSSWQDFFFTFPCLGLSVCMGICFGEVWFFTKQINEFARITNFTILVFYWCKYLLNITFGENCVDEAVDYKMDLVWLGSLWTQNAFSYAFYYYYFLNCAIIFTIISVFSLFQTPEYTSCWWKFAQACIRSCIYIVYTMLIIVQVPSTPLPQRNTPWQNL